MLALPKKLHTFLFVHFVNVHQTKCVGRGFSASAIQNILDIALLFSNCLLYKISFYKMFRQSKIMPLELIVGSLVNNSYMKSSIVHMRDHHCL